MHILKWADEIRPNRYGNDGTHFAIQEEQSDEAGDGSPDPNQPSDGNYAKK